MKNGRQIGSDHLATLNDFLAEGRPLPVSTKDGTLNLTELARATGIPKSSFYQNPAIKACLDTATEAQGIARWGATPNQADASAAQAVDGVAAGKRRDPAAERRLHRLEQQNAALVAENADLRQQLKGLRLRMGREDMMIDTGRRVVAPADE